MVAHISHFENQRKKSAVSFDQDGSKFSICEPQFIQNFYFQMGDWSVPILRRGGDPPRAWRPSPPPTPPPRRGPTCKLQRARWQGARPAACELRSVRAAQRARRRSQLGGCARDNGCYVKRNLRVYPVRARMLPVVARRARKGRRSGLIILHGCNDPTILHYGEKCLIVRQSHAGDFSRRQTTLRVSQCALT